ncbi:hypothetical protein SAMN05216488_2531 [Microbacterium sp. LKL04]|uniref:hypothetical protein n=1 Tax=Microbacterium sp. LKL04 TaxID=912630 RepID=UPI000875BAB8|nr:hypothetical protein [Microbacterium sp. LKL04]SCY60928.1 hypothetical protein SAMN05216488_2531 [Microbacterium sp. LKL04]
MSISLILLPAALAAAAAVGGTGALGAIAMNSGAKSDPRGESEAVPIAVQTRMKDPDLLAAALADLGAADAAIANGALTATIDGVEIVMSRTDDGVWGAHLSRLDGHEVTEAEATSLMTQLDAAYARHVQRAVAERIRSRADQAGFELVSETRDDDDTVTMVLNVRDYA